MSIARRAVLGAVMLLMVGMALGPVHARAATAPAPRWVDLTTRPVLANATFTLDGVPYTTGADGTVRIPTTKLTNLEQRMAFVSVIDVPLTQAHFDHFQAGPEIALTRQVVAVFNMTRFLHLRTVPALPNATFTLDGVPHTTGSDGTVTIATTGLTGLDRRLKFDTVATDTQTRAHFTRFVAPPQHGYWRDAIAVFDLSRGVQFSFTSPAGKAVPTARVTSMTIRSSMGEQLTLSGARLRSPVMLPAIHVSSVFQRRDQQMIRYTVQSVLVDGSNTVVPSQHAFFPAQTTAVRVSAMLFTLQVSVRDPVFGLASGKTLVLRRPDNTESRYRLTNGKVTIQGVARGDYELRAEGAGFGGWRPIVVSRDQSVELSPVSSLDLMTVAAVIFLVIGGLLFVGFRRRAGRRPGPALSGDVRTGADGGNSPSSAPGAGQDAPVRVSEPVG